MFLPVITKFSNLVIFTGWDKFKDEKIWNYAGSLKIPIYRGVHEKSNI